VVLCVPELDEDAAANPDCVVGTTARDVEDQLWRRIERQEEGLVLKDLDSRWTPGERDKAWVKLKPDYLPTEDIDVAPPGRRLFARCPSPRWARG
jgi:DNA ligase-4